VKKITRRFTYANVMSSIAVFLILGGATAVAAGLAKNSVGSKQLKKNAVSAAKIKKNAVTSAKIKKAAVDGSKVKDGSLTGADINLGSLGTVPSADKANSANSAGSAGNANTVGGQSVTKLFKTLHEGDSGVTVTTVAGFTFIVTCQEDDADVEVTAPTSTSWVMEAGGVPGNLEAETTDNYNSGEAGEPGSIEIDETSSGGDATYGTATFYGALSNGTVVSGDIGYDYNTFDNSPSDTCLVAGHLTSG
jgi:hypothetical protein